MQGLPAGGLPQACQQHQWDQLHTRAVGKAVPCRTPLVTWPLLAQHSQAFLLQEQSLAALRRAGGASCSQLGGDLVSAGLLGASLFLCLEGVKSTDTVQSGVMTELGHHCRKVVCISQGTTGTTRGHMTIVLITLFDSCLQTPMYFFLRNLSTIEICYILVIVPNMLANILSGSQRMPFLGCALQMHLFISLGGAECFLLAVMAYDRFVAICKPLHYPFIVTRTACVQMLALACISGFALSLTLTTLIFLLPFCQSHKINHFFCDIPAVLFLACSDTQANEIAVFLVCLLILLIPFLPILLSYGFIIAAILRIHSAEGRSKAFSTCAGHLLVSLLHYGCAIFIYIRPRSCYTPE
nr:unnamed protein product [Rangifer tarandus platyrhynchus]